MPTHAHPLREGGRRKPALTSQNTHTRAAEPGRCVTPQTRDIIDTLLRPSSPANLRESLLFGIYPVLSNAAAATLPRRMRIMASIPTSRAWETRSIVAGRAAVSAANLPPLSRIIENQISARGYGLMRKART